ncbi:DUF6542 domain-containing protein [Corynebacterium sp. Marseille-P4321]|uniref:DUF6542 domain-containing protein n=1 Tax=Corynebacterium sp. Marseille-P4321 TaxID=2736603 RepID=UPI00158E3B1D|nr:DUF6542 domain-containing protein [Corynebacterium sp. Marseille-P4321]
MSTQSYRNQPSPNATFLGLPTASGIGIIFAALFTGALISLSAGAISWPLLALYAVAVIAVTTLVNPKGLFLTVTSAPLLFVVALVATGYLMSLDEISRGGFSSKTALLFLGYPVAQFFPLLFSVTVGSLLIAVLRIWLIERRNASIRKYESAERSQRQASNQRTNTQGRRARERAKSVPVQELLERANSERTRQTSKQSRGTTRVVERLGDDLYRG